MEKNHQQESVYRQVLDLYGRFGIRSVTMDDISRELGISKKTLYQYIRDKNDLIHRVIDLDIRISKRFTDGLESSGSNAIEDLFEINQRIYAQRQRLSPTFYYDLKKYYPEHFRRWNREKHTHVYTLISGNIAKGKKEGLYREKLNGEVIAGLYLSRMERLEETDPYTNADEHSEDWIREVFTYHLHGICNRKGLQYLENNLPKFYEDT